MNRVLLGLLALAIFATPSSAAVKKKWNWNNWNNSFEADFTDNWGGGSKKKKNRKYSKYYQPVAVADGGPKAFVSAKSPKVANVSTGYKAGSVVVDQSSRKLYYMISKTKAYVYPVAVGKPGFKWTGTQKVSGVKDWPGWTPPEEMHMRKPGLPLHMTGGLRNPLGAKAIYLGSTEYRIHGTNDSRSIGTAASSGCIRMHNGHVVHLSNLIRKGTKVHVVSGL
jgi:lipoprotein-anchoring transpeptidase ErfK/SrfK